MSKVRFFQTMPVKALRHPLWYRIRELLRGNPTDMGRKVILPGDDYGSWNNGFHPAAMPVKTKNPR